MRLISLTVENFRCYAAPLSVRFNDFTALVGRNDVGKSSLMDALAIFFETASADKDDACKIGDPKLMRISCEFDQLPGNLVVDTDFQTTLASEYLLSANNTLIVQKTYNGSIATPRLVAIEAIANHPTAEGYDDLLTLKKAELIKRASDLKVNLEDTNKRANAPIRAAIWRACDDLRLEEKAVSLDSEGSKVVWSSLQQYLPTFALFKSDRASSDQDAEAQDPLKAAIREAIKAVEPQLQEVRDFVEAEVKKIAGATVEKLREMDASIAETLNPVITSKKPESLFSTSITGDEGIPLNKRGSGVKRLILLNFFRAKAEKDATEKNSTSVIYAIEEPETSQHPRNQRLLLNALRELATGDGRQVIITTHTPMLARYLPETDLRFIQRSESGVRSISEGGTVVSAEIAKSLGVLPDHNVKIFVGVEGPHDISFLKGIAQILIDAGENLPNLNHLELEGKLIFFPFGGSNLALWASRLTPLNRPEFHICDRDSPPPAEPKYAAHMSAINQRDGCVAVTTRKREMESYLHPQAIREAYAEQNISIILPESFADFDDVPVLVAQAVQATEGEISWAELKEESRRKKVGKAKFHLNNGAIMKMTAERLSETDPNDEIRGWLNEVNRLMAAVES